MPAPLRDRCRVLSLRPPDYGEELAFIRREGAARLGPERAGLLAEAFDRQRRGRPAGLRRIMRILGNAAGGRRDAALH